MVFYFECRDCPFDDWATLCEAKFLDVQLAYAVEAFQAVPTWVHGRELLRLIEPA